MSVMPFKGMLKWAVAKEDPKQSTTHLSTATATTKSLLKCTTKKRRSKHIGQYHHHYPSILKTTAVEENNAKNINKSRLPPVDSNKDVDCGGGGGGNDRLTGFQNSEGGAQICNGANKNSVKFRFRKKMGNVASAGGVEALARDNKNVENGTNGTKNTANNNNSIDHQIRTNNPGQNRHSSADSKSLLYMSLDHLPLAIVKQYERMLQEAEEQKKPLEMEKRAKTAEDVDTEKKALKKKKKARSATVVVDAKALMEATIKSDEKPLQGIIKSSSSYNGNNGQKKITIISPPSNKQAAHHQQNKSTETTTIATPSPVISNIKEAKSRALQTTGSFRTKVVVTPKRKTPSPEAAHKKIRERSTQTSGGRCSPPKSRFKVTIVNTPPLTPPEVTKRDASVETDPKCFPLKSILKEGKSSTLPRPRKNSLESLTDERSQKNTVNTGGNQRSSSFRSTSSKSTTILDVSTSPVIPKKVLNISTPNLNGTNKLDHDLTDPQFLESSMAVFTPAVARCAKKLTLKRSEIRKLERIRNQTEKLNRFLKKYYHDCLPNLPEEEEESCAPEEKSVHLSVLREHWVENKPEESAPRIAFTRRNTLPVSSSFPLEPASLLSSSAYYSDPMLSSLPVIIETPELLLEHQKKLIKQKSCTNLVTTQHSNPPPARRASVTSCSSSCSCTTTSSTECHCSSGTASSTSSIISLAADFRMAEVLRQDPRIHESFLMSTHNFSGGSTHPDPDNWEEDNSLLDLQQREIINRQVHCIPTAQNANELELATPDATLLPADTFPLASPAPVLELRQKNDDNNNSYKKNNAEEGNKKRKVMISFACEPPHQESLSRGVRSSVNSDDGADATLVEKHVRLQSSEGKLKGEQKLPDTKINGMITECGAASSSFEVPTSNDDDHHEDEGFMSPYPPEAYSPSGSSSSGSTHSRQNLRSSLSSSGKGSAEDLEIEEIGDAARNETNLDLFFLDSTLPHGLIGKEENENENGDTDGEYATLTSCSSNSSYSEGVVCGSFFPNTNRFQVSRHERQLSSDSSSCYYAPAVIQQENTAECETRSYHHHYDIPEESKEHIYDQVANDDPEQSVIIQSSAGLLVANRVQQASIPGGIAFSTPISKRIPQRRIIIENNTSSILTTNASVISTGSSRRVTPARLRKVVKKTPVVRNTPYSGKGEVLVRCYKNGSYVTVHVVQAKNLQVCYLSSWKLSMKISLIPEGETTLTKSESVLVPRAKGCVKIDEKFSFELPTETNKKSRERKVFLTFIKRIEKRSTFLGWLTLPVPQSQNISQFWLKLRKRKMSSASYTSPPHHHLGRRGEDSSIHTMVGLPSHYPTEDSQLTMDHHNMNGVAILPNHHIAPHIPQSGSNSCYSDDEVPDHTLQTHHQYNNSLTGKICQIQNSATMDSGVEDCCDNNPQSMAASQPPPVNHMPNHVDNMPSEVPCIELDDNLGFRVRVHMAKPEGAGFGFSVVWVSPPRIERLEKDKTADLAGLKIGDLIIGVNGEDVTNVPNTTIYNKMKSTGQALDLEVWRKHPHATSPLPPHHMNVPNPINPAHCIPPPPGAPPAPPTEAQSGGIVSPPAATVLPIQSSSASSKNATAVVHSPPPASTGLPSTSSNSSHPPQGGAPPPVRSTNPLLQRIIQAQQQQNGAAPTSILKPPPPQASHHHSPLQKHGNNQQQSATGSSSWRIRFNIELLDNEDDNLKQFFICELKYFRKVVAALDRYLIPAQAKRLLTPQEIHLIFAQVIKIITMTKRILQCVANGSTNSNWKLGRILLSTHTDHLPDITSAYTAYAKGLAQSARILAEKMSIQEFAKFVVEMPVPKGHLDMTALLFAPFEHLRNLCEIAEEISHHHDNWVVFNTRLKECYADIVCETDFMEPISHVSMKKNPLLSVRDLEKRIISTTSQQPLKVCEKGRKWLFGSRLYRRENDGSWSPVWAFLFTDIIVLTSHMTRDRVFFVKEAPIRLDDVVTLHFNLPKKHENEFRLLFGPDSSHHSRLDRILPLVRSKKPNQVVLRTANSQLKSLWKLLLQRQIISLNTRLSKSASSNFSISEFCEKFPVVQHDSILEEDEDRLEVDTPTAPTTSFAANTRTTISTSSAPQAKHVTTSLPNTTSTTNSASSRSVQPGTPMPTMKKPIPIRATQQMTTPLKQVQVPPPQEICIRAPPSTSVPERSSAVTSPPPKPYVPDGLSIINKDLLKTRVTRRPSIPPGSGVSPPLTQSRENTPPVTQPAPKHVDACTSTSPEVPEPPTSMSSAIAYSATTSTHGVIPPVPKPRSNLPTKDAASQNTPVHATTTRTTSSASPIPSHNNNNTASDKCPCDKMDRGDGQAYPSPKPRQLSALKRADSKVSPVEASNVTAKPPQVNVVAASPQVVKKQPTEIATSLASNLSGTPSKSKPGPRIMTNATLKSRQQEIIATQQQSQQAAATITTTNTCTTTGTKPSISTETIRTDKSSDTTCTNTSKTEDSTQYFSLKEETSTATSTTTSSSISSIQQNPPHPSPSSSTTSGGGSGLRCAHSKNLVVHHQHHAHHCPVGLCGGSPSHLNVPMQPRCHSENSHHPPTTTAGILAKKSGKAVHTDSPIISGYGSERARRRMLFDNKLKKDYPELFGITPKDRRSFIKQLGETTEEVLGGGKALVAPYYYTLSPVPIAKHAMMMTMQMVAKQNGASSLANGSNRIQCNSDKSSACVSVSASTSSGPLVIPPYNPNGKSRNEQTSEVPLTNGDKSRSVGATTLATLSKNCTESVEEEQGEREILEVEINHHPNMNNHDVYTASLELDDEGQRLKDFVEKMRQDMDLSRHTPEDVPEEDEEEEEEEDSDDEDDSDDTSTADEDPACFVEGAQSHRSHEESSNDSGISDEMTEKSKTTLSGLMEDTEDISSSATSSTGQRVGAGGKNFALRTTGVIMAAEVKNSQNSQKSCVFREKAPSVGVKLPSCRSSPKSSSTASTNSSSNSVSSTKHVAIVSSNDSSTGGQSNFVAVAGKNCVVDVNSVAASSCLVDKLDKLSDIRDSAKISSHPKNFSSCSQGETPGSVETVVVLDAPDPGCHDKATETTHDDFLFLSQLNNDKPLRSILAERREQFFSSVSSSPSTGGCGQCHHNNHNVHPYAGGFIHPKPVEPLVVKIVDGGTIQTAVDPNIKETPPAPCERVQLQRLERSKKAKVERVESSEDSTSSSSDLASASPGAAENGTTDPSWSSSSSSSLAGLTNEPAPRSSTPAQPTLARSSSVDVATSTAGDFPAVTVAGQSLVSTTPASLTATATAQSTSSSSCQESSTTSSKSYSLLLESDFSSFDSIEPPSCSSSGVPSGCCSAKMKVVTIPETDEQVSSSSSGENSSEASLSNPPTGEGGASDMARLLDASDLEEVDSLNGNAPSSEECSQPKSDSSGKKSVNRVVVVVSNGGGDANKPDIVVTQESEEEEEESSSHSHASTQSHRHGYSSDGEEDSIVCKDDKAGSSGGGATQSGDSEDDGGGSSSINSNRSTNGSFKQKLAKERSGRGSFLRVESNDSTAENFGDDDDYQFDDEEEDDLSHCSVATINRYGTFESLEKLESEDTLGGLPGDHFGGRGGMSRSKARFTFEDEDDDEDDEDLFEEDFETDFNFRFPSQIQDNTYSVSRLGPLPPLLEEDYEDEMYDETRGSGVSPSSSGGEYSGGSLGGGIPGGSSGLGAGASLRSRHETGLRRDNSFLLARLATMYARSSISPLKILRELWLKKSRQQPVPAPAPPPTYSPTTGQMPSIPTMAVQGMNPFAPQHGNGMDDLQPSTLLPPPQPQSQQKLVLIKSSNSQEMIFLAESTDPVVMMAVVPTMTPVMSTPILHRPSTPVPTSPPPPPPQFSDPEPTENVTISTTETSNPMFCGIPGPSSPRVSQCSPPSHFGISEDIPTNTGI